MKGKAAAAAVRCVVDKAADVVAVAGLSQLTVTTHASTVISADDGVALMIMLMSLFQSESSAVS